MYDCLLTAMAAMQTVDVHALFLFVGDLNVHASFLFVGDLNVQASFLFVGD